MSSASHRLHGTVAFSRPDTGAGTKFVQRMVFSAWVASVVTFGGLVSLYSRLAGKEYATMNSGQPSELATPWGLDQD